MADAKISALTNNTDPAYGDMLPLVNVDGADATQRTSLGLLQNWIAVDDAWAYASATTITVPSGAAAIYSVGDKVKLTQPSGTKYFYIVGVADTVLTVTGGSDYTVANQGITFNMFSKTSSPVGFPQYFAYTPTGVSASGVTLSGRFSIFGRTCKVNLLATFTGAITFTTMPTLPVAASASHLFAQSTNSPSGVAGYSDTGTATVNGTIYPSVIASATTVALKVSATGADISASSPITWANTDRLSCTFDYEI